MTRIQYAVPFLVATLLVPTGMAFADTQKASDVEKINKVIMDYKKALKKAETGQEKKDMQDAIERLQIAKKFTRHSNAKPGVAGASGEQNTADHKAKAEKLLESLDATYSAESETKNPVVGESGKIVFQKSFRHIQKQYDCEDNRYVTGTIKSALKHYGGSSTIISGTMLYPDEFDKDVKKRKSTTCTNFEHEESKTKFYALANRIPGSGHIRSGVCTISSDMPNGSDRTSCSVFSTSRINLAVTTSEYESGRGTSQLGGITSEVFIS